MYLPRYNTIIHIWGIHGKEMLIKATHTYAVWLPRYLLIKYFSRCA